VRRRRWKSPDKREEEESGSTDREARDFPEAAPQLLLQQALPPLQPSGRVPVQRASFLETTVRRLDSRIATGLSFE